MLQLQKNHVQSKKKSPTSHKSQRPACDDEQESRLKNYIYTTPHIDCQQL